MGVLGPGDDPAGVVGLVLLKVLAEATEAKLPLLKLAFKKNITIVLTYDSR
jgi:hypothetical protein